MTTCSTCGEAVGTHGPSECLDRWVHQAAGFTGEVAAFSTNPGESERLFAKLQRAPVVNMIIRPGATSCAWFADVYGRLVSAETYPMLACRSLLIGLGVERLISEARGEVPVEAREEPPRSDRFPILSAPVQPAPVRRKRGRPRKVVAAVAV